MSKEPMVIVGTARAPRRSFREATAIALKLAA